MEQQHILNSIATLSATIGSLLSADKKDEVTIVVDKIVELVGRLQ